MPDKKEKPVLFISSSPHIGSPVSTSKIMTRVIIALAPVSLFGVLLYGIPALLTIIVSIISAVAAEILFRKITKQEMHYKNLSAVVTGLLLALILPPEMPLWMTALSAFFAVIVAKEFFGGIGGNVFNPALIGRAFALLSFPVAATHWTIPRAFFSANSSIANTASGAVADALSGATTLGIVKLAVSNEVSWGAVLTAMKGAVTDVGSGFAALGLAGGSDYWSTIQTLFLGNHGGSIGESSILLILAGFVYLFITGTIDWRAPVSMVAAVFLFSLILTKDPGFALFAILSGGVFFGAVFMATDYVSAPLFPSGKLIFGFCAGLITVLIRQFGNYPEGVTYGILIMNAVTPFINRIHEKKYGYVKPVKTPAAGGSK